MSYKITSHLFFLTLKCVQNAISYVKEKGILLLIVLITGALVNSAGFALAQNNQANSSNQTSSANTSGSLDNLGQHVSEFVHSFKQQRTEIIEAIKDCRDAVRNADNEEDRTKAHDACKQELKQIREKYKAERTEFRQLFKQYRDSMKALIKEAKKHEITLEQKEKDDNKAVLILSSATGKGVTICHIPPGNAANPQTITVDSNAVAAHLAHGDTIGECDEQTHDVTDSGSEHDGKQKGKEDIQAEDDNEDSHTGDDNEHSETVKEKKEK